MKALYGLLGGLPRFKMFAVAGLAVLGSCLAIAAGPATPDAKTMFTAAAHDDGLIILHLAADTSDSGSVLLAQGTAGSKLVADPFDGLSAPMWRIVKTVYRKTLESNGGGHTMAMYDSGCGKTRLPAEIDII